MPIVPRPSWKSLCPLLLCWPTPTPTTSPNLDWPGHVPPMKDFIIGSDEFLVREIEQIEQQVSLTSCPKHPLPNGTEQELHEDNQRNMPISKNRDFFNTTTGQTPLHSFSALIKSFPPCMMKSQKVQGIPGLTVQHASPARVNRPPAVYW